MVLVALGVSLGPVAGGVLTQFLGWRWIFYVNLPIGAALLLAAWRLLTQRQRVRRQRFDVAGAALLAVGLAALTLGISFGQEWGWGSPRIVAVMAVALAALGGAAWVERRADAPVLDLALLRSRVFVLSNVTFVDCMLALFAVGFLLPFYFEELRGFDTLQSGLLLTPLALTLAAVAPASGSLADRLGSRWLPPLGLAIAVLGLVLLSGLNQGSPIPYIVGCLVVTWSGPGDLPVAELAQADGGGSARAAGPGVRHPGDGTRRGPEPERRRGGRGVHDPGWGWGRTDACLEPPGTGQRAAGYAAAHIRHRPARRLPGGRWAGGTRCSCGLRPGRGLSSGGQAVETISSQDGGEHMKAVVFKGTREVGVTEVEDATIEEPTDVVLRITASALCATDLHMYDGRTGAEPGLVLGHEPLGAVEAVGSAVELVHEGDRVVVPTHLFCGLCFNCVRGYSAACLRVRPGSVGAAYGYAGMGLYRGAQAELLRVPYADANCIQLPGEPGDEYEDDFVPAGGRLRDRLARGAIGRGDPGE
jgi:hypothetical protein